MTKNWKKIYSWKKLHFFGSKNTIYLPLGLHKGHPTYKRSLQLSKELFIIWNSLIFSTFVGNFCPPGSGFHPLTRSNPDPLTRLNPDPIRIRFRKPATDTQKDWERETIFWRERGRAWTAREHWTSWHCAYCTWRSALLNDFIRDGKVRAFVTNKQKNRESSNSTESHIILDNFWIFVG